MLYIHKGYEDVVALTNEVHEAITKMFAEDLLPDSETMCDIHEFMRTVTICFKHIRYLLSEMCEYEDAYVDVPALLCQLDVVKRLVIADDKYEPCKYYLMDVIIAALRNCTGA